MAVSVSRWSERRLTYTTVLLMRTLMTQVQHLCILVYLVRTAKVDIKAVVKVAEERVAAPGGRAARSRWAARG